MLSFAGFNRTIAEDWLMKSCPTCNRTYPDDTLAFCLVDGSVLSAPYDPEQTQRIPPPRTTSSAATEVLAGTAPSGGSLPLRSTIRAPAPQVPPLHPANVSEVRTDSAKKSILPRLLISAAILLVGIFGVAMLALRFSPNQDSSTSRPSPTATATIADQSRSACGHIINSALYDKWVQMSREIGKLGCPISDEAEAPASPQRTTGRWIQFASGDGGYLIEHRSGANAGKVFEVSGCMFKLYASVGGTKSWLGFPVSGERETSTGARQDFEGGYVLWDRKTYVCDAHKP